MKGYENPQLGHYPGGDYDYWACVIIRGNNYQLDTLPLMPVETTIPCGWLRSGPEQADECRTRPQGVVSDIG